MRRDRRPGAGAGRSEGYRRPKKCRLEAAARPERNRSGPSSARASRSRPFEIDYLLRKDSELQLECERLERWPTRRLMRTPKKFEWQVPDPPAGHEVMALLGELDGLVPGVSAEVLITVPQYSYPSIPMQGTREGFLRFGLEFARGAVVAGSGQGTPFIVVPMVLVAALLIYFRAC